MPKTTVELNGQWECKEYPLEARRIRDLGDTDWLCAKVPSSIYTSLIDAGLINKTDIDSNPEDFAWVSEKPWIFKKSFDLTDDILDCDRINLLFEGLDTVASIWLNEKLIAKTSNMFIHHRFDVTKHLKKDKNILMIKFDPAVDYAKKLMNRYTTFTDDEFENPYRVYIRKAQYQFGWDFCPQLPGCGIFRFVELQGIQKNEIEHVNVKTIDCDHQHADIRIAIKLDTVTNKELNCHMSLSWGHRVTNHSFSFKPGEDFHSTILHIKKPKLWFPKGYGPQNLYNLDINLYDQRQLIDHIEKKIGIRRIKLRKALNKKSSLFRFEINDKKVYAKGANWVPPSIFPGSVTPDQYIDLINKADNANFNMLRIWGGGYYEDDIFYELCDKLGIMVWQDFMFACAYYPDRKWFIDDVKIEAAAVIKRLSCHPSLVLWCGNNEIDWMHHTQRLSKGRKFFAKEIYHRILPQFVTELGAGTPYIPTTPLSEKGSYKEMPTMTTHQWKIWSEHQPARNYICKPQEIPSFVTEFGLQSMPDITTLKKCCPEKQMNIGTQYIEKHNYQLDGNSRLYRYSADLFGTTDNLELFIYLSQITQARAAKNYVEHLRAHNSVNNGVLFWQFNDSAPAITWAAIDYYANPKALYYYAKQFFADIVITVLQEKPDKFKNVTEKLNDLTVIAVNDTSTPLTATLNCRLIDLFGNLIDKVTLPLAIGPHRNSTPVKLPKAFNKPENPNNTCLVVAIEKENKTIAQNIHLYLPDKYIDWPKTKIKKQLDQLSQNKWLLKLTSDSVAKDVQLSTCSNAQFSDNFVDLFPNKVHEFTITGENLVHNECKLISYQLR